MMDQCGWDLYIVGRLESPAGTRGHASSLLLDVQGRGEAVFMRQAHRRGIRIHELNAAAGP